MEWQKRRLLNIHCNFRVKKNNMFTLSPCYNWYTLYFVVCQKTFWTTRSFFYLISHELFHYYALFSLAACFIVCWKLSGLDPQKWKNDASAAPIHLMTQYRVCSSRTRPARWSVPLQPLHPIAPNRYNRKQPDDFFRITSLYRSFQPPFTT